jgi:hypothetical protein
LTGIETNTTRNKGHLADERQVRELYHLLSFAPIVRIPDEIFIPSRNRDNLLELTVIS